MTADNTIKYLMAVGCYLWMRICRRSSYGLILFYHGVSSEYRDVFHRQIEYLVKRHTIVSATSISSSLCADGRRHKNAVAIMFDDAFENVLKNAVPILQRYRAPAAVCVPTGHMGRKAAWRMSSDCAEVNESVITREQISVLDRQGFEICSHTVSHCPLATLDEQAIQYELEKSKAALEDIVGHDVVSISYPHGSFNAAVLRAAERAGYRYGYTIEPSVVRQGSDPLRYGRVSVALSDPMFVFRLKAAGAFQIVVWLRRLKKTICDALRWKRHSRDV